ncbi:MAG: glucosaminidase domain-containing protein [Limnochordaceae bacterium]|nr:glucosaminidase domain-containing protein [Limnochordaceae bacterium]
MSPEEFVTYLYPAARQVEQETGIPAAAILAQVALETTWLSKPGAAIPPAQRWMSLRQYANDIRNEPRYRQAVAAAARGDPILYLAELLAAGYSDDPTYFFQVECILRRHILPLLSQQAQA